MHRDEDNPDNLHNLHNLIITIRLTEYGVGQRGETVE